MGVSGNRHSLPQSLSGCTEFSDQPELMDPLWAVRKLKSNPQWLDLLIDGTDLNRNWGRPRSAGSWALAYLAFVVSRHSDVEPWVASSSQEVWTECGFPTKPSYQTVWLRFAELEQTSDVFAGVSARLIRHAREHSGGLVGRDIHVDGTEAETNARLRHDCPEGTCRKDERPKPASAVEAQALRHQEDAKPPERPDSLKTGETEKGEKIVMLGGCRFLTWDTLAGVRAYSRGDQLKKFWHGYYNAKAIDHYTGAPIAVLVSSASEQEYDAYPRLLDATLTALDDTPRSVVADRGYSYSQIFELNTRQGIASVMPYRAPHRNLRKRKDEDEFDRHGIPRCKHCGAQSKFVRFAATPYPRLWFKCLDGTTLDCNRTQSVACSKSWRSLLPLWRLEPAYMALRESHQVYERVHHHWRSRYKVGGATHAERPKRLGIACQQLRANAALLIEWLRILYREGWTGSARRNRGAIKDARDPEPSVQNLIESRIKSGVHLPYGPKAVELGIGPMRPGEPPSGPAPPDPDPVPF